MTTHKIQELLDEHKEDMNENIYLQLCNKLMKINSEEEKEQKVFKITYLEPYIKKSEFNNFEIDMRSEQLYLPLTKKEHKDIVDRLDKWGHFTAHLFYHKMQENNTIIWSYAKSEFDEDLYNECCGYDRRQCLEMNCSVGDCALITKRTDFKVKCWREIVKIEKYDNPEM